MAGQPVKRGNWGDWAVIERSPRFKHNCCGGCVNYCYEDDSCNVFPIAGYEIGANFWRTCPKYCTKCHYIVKSQYIRYRSEQSNPLPQPALTSSMPKAHTRYKPNPSITVGMDVIDNEHNVGTVLSFDYKQNKIYVKYPSDTIEYQFPNVFINHQLKKYYKTTGQSLVIDYFPKINSASKTKKYHDSAFNQNLGESFVRHKTMQALGKNVHDLEFFDFTPGMSVYSMHKGVGVIDSVLSFQNQISVRFGKEQISFRIPVDFTNGTLALLDNSVPQSTETFLQLRANLLAQMKPTSLKIQDFKCGMEIADISQGLGKITEICKCDYIWISFSDDVNRGFMYKVPDDFVNGRLKIVIE